MLRADGTLASGFLQDDARNLSDLGCARWSGCCGADWRRGKRLSAGLGADRGILGCG